jgi:RNA polymerase sigma-70 factor, ECF subfamily
MDQNILIQLKTNDKKALRVLFDKYYEPLVRFAIFHLNEIEPSEEIVQDLFIYLWEKRDVLEIEISLESYLYKSVRNKCLNHLKSKTYRLFKVTENESSLLNSPSASYDSLETAELEELLSQAIAEIPEKTAVIFNYSRNVGLKHAEIAEKMNISIKTVEYHIGSAMKSIKSYLEKYGYLIVLWLFN